MVSVCKCQYIKVKDGSLKFSDLSDFYDQHTLLVKAAVLNDMASLTYLLTDPYYDITQTDANGETIFHHAARSAGSNVFALLDATSEKGRVYRYMLATLKCTEHELQQMINRFD